MKKLRVATANAALTEAVANDGWLDDEAANLAMGYGVGEEGARRAYSGFIEALGEQPRAAYGVYRSDEPVAFVVVRRPTDKLAQFHGVVAPKYRKTIWAARVIEAIERATLGNGSYRLETEILTKNERAMRLLKGLGFKPEGAHRARIWMDGKAQTTVTLRLLKPEWKERR